MAALLDGVSKVDDETVRRLRRLRSMTRSPATVHGELGAVGGIGAQPPPDGRAYDSAVIFITAKFRVQPDHADRWDELTRAFTDATRAEPGNLWFEWSRSLDDPTEYVLVEAFRDGEAGAAHVQSDHFQVAITTLPGYLVETPRIVSQMIDQDDWSELGEMQVGQGPAVSN
jgi:quinol monooxygenase YgiN